MGKDRLFHFRVTIGLGEEIAGQGINRFGADAVKSYALLESFTIVFGTCIDLGNTVYHFAEGDSTSKVPDRHYLIANRYVDSLSVPTRMLVDRVVDDFLQQNINPIVSGCSISQFPDVHSRPEPDMLTRA